MVEGITTSLLERQNPDGGWGSGLSGPSQTEATSLAVISMGAGSEKALVNAVQAGKVWLRDRQRPDGAWPRSDEVPEASWMTSLAMVALGGGVQDRARVRAAAGWLVGSEGRAGSLLGRLVALFTRTAPNREMDDQLRGWPWSPGTFGWIEPTAYALLALKLARSDHSSPKTERRIRDGELMLVDRMCPGGGWNYGNPRVLGEDLWPFPDTTALALIALQDLPMGKPVEESLLRLESIISEVESGLSLALSAICFGFYGRDQTDLLAKLEAEWEATAFGGETRPAALAVLALENGGNPLRLGTQGGTHG